MNTRKLLDKFRGWAQRDPVMTEELTEANAEFFAFYEEPGDADLDRDLVGLFIEWFLYDRKTTRYLKTPVEVFLRYSGRAFSKKEKDFYRALAGTIFGAFEILACDREAGFVHVKRLDGEGEWRLKDVAGSNSMEAGYLVFARIIPLAEEPAFTGWVTGFPLGAGEIKAMLDKVMGPPEKRTGLKPRHLLGLWSQPEDWLAKGEFFCKTRLAGVWQRWCGGKPFAELESAVDSGDYDKYLQVQETLLENCPAPDQIGEATKLLEAYWNLASGKKSGAKAPVELAGPGPGPVEKKFLKLLGDAVFGKHQRTGEDFSGEETDAWLKDPGNGENGRSPFELITEERKKNGHPYPDKIAYSMTVRPVENKASGLAVKQHQAALAHMIRNDFKGAAALFEQALAVLKHDRAVSFRLFGNLGICYALMGEKERAFEALREALRHNPDYDRARTHLSDLEAMTDEEYAKFLKDGPGNLAHTEWHGQD